MIVEISHFLTILSAGLFLLTALFSFSFDNKNINVINLTSKLYNHSFLLLLSSFGIYIFLAANDYFSVLYIAQHSNTNLPLFYKISSIWSAHEGSMFLWIVFLALWGFFYNISTSVKQQLKALSIGVIALIIVGFLFFLLFTSNPFETILPIAPSNGADINPVLQDPALAIHPPILYLGYVGFVIAFANAIAFLIEGNSTIKWESFIRTWSLAAWAFLTVGITLGSWWAYYELGWGGYWFWDPVENVALIPWLLATAFIHSVYVSAKSSTLRIWTVLLSILVFSMSLFGAFIVRSGIIDSIHSFANDPTRGMYLLLFTSIIILSAFSLFILRVDKLKSEKKIKTFSKESFVSINNIIFATLAFTTILGVLYPLIYEYLFDQQISVGAPFYNAIFIPITLIAGFFMIYSINSKWSTSNIKSKILNATSLSFVLSFCLMAIFMALTKITNIWIITSIFTGMLIFVRYLIVIFLLISKKKYSNPFSILAHLGLALLIISIALNNELSSERAILLKLNESSSFEGYKIKFQNIELENNDNFDSVKGTFIFEDRYGQEFALFPEKRRYFARGQITTETSIFPTILKDIYITLGDQLEDGNWVVNIQFNYFIRWIWFSTCLMALSGILLLYSLNKNKRSLL